MLNVLFQFRDSLTKFHCQLTNIGVRLRKLNHCSDNIQKHQVKVILKYIYQVVSTHSSTSLLNVKKLKNLNNNDK